MKETRCAQIGTVRSGMQIAALSGISLAKVKNYLNPLSGKK